MKKKNKINIWAAGIISFALVGIIFLNTDMGRDMIGSNLQPVASDASPKQDSPNKKIRLEPTEAMIREVSNRRPVKNPTSGVRYSTRFVYLVPSDRATSDAYTNGVKAAAQNLQSWFRNNTTVNSTTGKTIILNTNIVEVYKTNHTEAWYRGNGGSGEFWNNALADGFALTGAKFNDPYYRWIFYIDSDNGPGQIIGGTSGVALMGQDDLMGLTGNSTDGTSVNRWYGGAGHEVGHAMNLPHPPGCEQDASSALCQTALMYLGYTTYPNAILTTEDRQALNSLPFFKL